MTGRVPDYFTEVKKKDAEAAWLDEVHSLRFTTSSCIVENPSAPLFGIL